LNLQAVYTWSHSISDFPLNDSGGVGDASYVDVFNPSLDRGNSTINRPHIFVVNAIVNLPSLKGQNGFVRNTLGDWEFATITTLASGNSQTVFSNGVSAPGLGLKSLSAQGSPTTSGQTLFRVQIAIASLVAHCESKSSTQTRLPLPDSGSARSAPLLADSVTARHSEIGISRCIRTLVRQKG